MVVARAVHANAVFGAGRENWMRERDFAVIEDDHRDVFKRYAGRLLLLNHQREMLPLEFGGLADDHATPDHGAAQGELGSVSPERRYSTFLSTVLF